jgi:hypothetical protein
LAFLAVLDATGRRQRIWRATAHQYRHSPPAKLDPRLIMRRSCFKGAELKNGVLV